MKAPLHLTPSHNTINLPIHLHLHIHIYTTLLLGLQSSLPLASTSWKSFHSTMAAITQQDFSESRYFSPARRRMVKNDGQQKRKEELEKEVSMLVKMLDREEKVNKFLEHTISRPDGSAIHIPTFLPPRVKELLAELAMVENEIARLETQITHLQKDLTHEENISMESKSKQGFSFETKAMYYINKAIKGDYTASPLASNENRGNDTTDHKEKYSHGDEANVQKKSGTQKTSSPKLPPKNTFKEHEIKFSYEFPASSISNVSQPEEKSKKMQPNKLSESIMKCLTLIFVRVLRATRAIELEKTGAVSRSTPASLRSISFRVESPSLNSKTSLVSKESKQQDPYGIFDIDNSIPRDIGPYKNLVRFTLTSLDPKTISNSGSGPLIQNLRGLMNNLQNVDLRFLNQQQKLAFWINMYNACMMHGFLQYGVPSSQESLVALMEKATLNIEGNKLNAIAIENFILRQPKLSNSNDVYENRDEYAKESVIRSLYGLQYTEPNITFALCCGTRSSPAVRIYTAESVTADLEKAKLEYLQAAIVVTDTKRLLIPELLMQNKFDFARRVDSLVEWICHQLPTSGSLRKSIVQCFRGHSSSDILENVDQMPYDFGFQYLLFV